MAGKIKILIVDDEERFLQTLCQRLELRDFSVTAVNNGEQAVKVASQESFELAILDLKMPGMDGEKVLELLKKNDPYIEVIILTGHGSLESAVHCSKLGSHGYLQKPCETHELLQVLKEAYKSRVRRKTKLNENGIDNLLGQTEENDQNEILRILKKAEQIYSE